MNNGDCPRSRPKRQPTADAFLNEVVQGLRAPQKRLPCKYFYDERGCRLFEQICGLDEYYLTRAELAIMERWAGQMAAALGPGCMLIEYGSGSSTKTRLLLDLLDRPIAYAPVDIASGLLRQTSEQVAGGYPELEVLPVCADFTARFTLPRPRGAVRRKVAYFPGSTVGNFPEAEAARLLENIADLCGAGGGLIIGIDLKKDAAVLEAAYNDRRRVTAAFNLNLLQRINRELGGDFRLDQFRHHAFYNAQVGRIEMHLISLANQTVSLGGERFGIKNGESICTEHSHKYSLDQFVRIAAHAGFALQQSWTDGQQRFAVLYLVVAGGAGR